MSFFKHTGAFWRFRTKQFIGRHPALYNVLFRYRPGYESRLVDDGTDICIEGFPRSANSFAVGAFEFSQSQSHSIAHHNHVPAPVCAAVQRGIPAVVLIREPVASVISLRGLQLQIGAAEGKEMPMHVSYTDRLWAWRSFYETVWPLREQVVVAPFAAVTEDFGRVIAAVNDQFGTHFDEFEHTEAHVSAVHERRGGHALPSEQRDALKKRARKRFEREVGTKHIRVRKARELYDRFSGYATVC